MVFKIIWFTFGLPNKIKMEKKKKDERPAPLACRPSKGNEYLYKLIAKEAKKMKLKKSAYIEHCLISYHDR